MSMGGGIGGGYRDNKVENEKTQNQQQKAKADKLNMVFANKDIEKSVTNSLLTSS